jgi:AcrR family transcriptional regulator
MAKDRRIQKTHLALRDAISELVEEKPYDQISVKDIVERANIARSSFYAHYRDKDDLLLSGFREIGILSSQDVFVRNEKGSGYPNFAIVLFRGAEQWKSMSRAFLSIERATVASHHMRNLLVIQAREWLKENTEGEMTALELEPIVHYLASALLGLMTWWVRNDFPFSADVMSDRFNQLAVQGLQSVRELKLK